MKMMLDFYAELRELSQNRNKLDENNFCTLRIKSTNLEEEANFLEEITQIAFVLDYEICSKISYNYYTDIILIDIDTSEFFKLYDIFEIILI